MKTSSGRISPLWKRRWGYQTLIETYGMTQDEVSKTVGKSRPAVTNALRLLHLPAPVRLLLEEGRISAGHARALLGFSDEKEMLAAAKLAAEKQLSVREVERMAKKSAQDALQKPKKSRIPYFQEVELALHDHLGRKVQVQRSARLSLQIEFYGEEDLSELMRVLHLDQ